MCLLVSLCERDCVCVCVCACACVCLCLCMCAKLLLKVFSLLSLGAEKLFELGIPTTTDKRLPKKQVTAAHIPVGITALNLALKISSNYSSLSSHLASCLSRSSKINGELMCG